MDPKLSNFSSGQASALQKTAQHSPRLPELHLPLDKLNWTDQKGQNEAKYLKTTEKKMAEGSYLTFILFYSRQEDGWQSNPCNNSYKVRRLLISESCEMLHLFGLRQTNFFWWINNSIILLTRVDSIPSCTNSIIIFSGFDKQHEFYIMHGPPL